MELRQYDKRPLTVGAFKFDRHLIDGASLAEERHAEVNEVRFRRTLGQWRL